MNKLFTSFLMVALMCCFFSCKQAPKADKAETEAPKTEAPTSTEAKTLGIKTDVSKVSWVGTKPTGQHEGTFKVSAGEVAVKDGKVEGGKFTIDINSLAVTDEGFPDDMKAKLGGHLKSADFFEVEKFPTAEFVITSVKGFKGVADSTNVLLKDANSLVTGNLTLKGVTKSVTFPAVVKTAGNTVSAKANFNIERTDWGLTYGADKSLGDKFIRPTVNVGFDILAQ